MFVEVTISIRELVQDSISKTRFEELIEAMAASVIFRRDWKGNAGTASTGKASLINTNRNSLNHKSKQRQEKMGWETYISMTQAPGRISGRHFHRIISNLEDFRRSIMSLVGSGFL